MDFKSKDIICGIYSLTNKINGMIYVGQSKDIYSRMRRHRTDYKRRNQPIYIAFREFGFNNFKLDILELCSEKDLNDIEIKWIKNLNCKEPNGYNMTNGGLGSSGLKMKEEHRLKIIEINTGRKCSDNTKKKMSKRFKNMWRNEQYRKNHSGENAPMYGKKHKKETKIKMSNIAKERNFVGHLLENKETYRRKTKKWHENNKDFNTKNVVMLDKDTRKELKSFPSMKIAGEWISENTLFKKANGSGISAVCRGRAKSCYGYGWKYGK